MLWPAQNLHPFRLVVKSDGRKKSVQQNFYIHSGLLPNRMGLEMSVKLNFYIQSSFSPYPVDFEKHVLLELYIQIEASAESDGGNLLNAKTGYIHTWSLAESDGAPSKKCPNGLHPNMAFSRIRWRTSCTGGFSRKRPESSSWFIQPLIQSNSKRDVPQPLR